MYYRVTYETGLCGIGDSFLVVSDIGLEEVELTWNEKAWELAGDFLYFDDLDEDEEFEVFSEVHEIEESDYKELLEYGYEVIEI